MSNDTKVILSKGGTAETVLRICEVVIPDLWHIAEALRKNNEVADGPACADLILECWNRAHDLKRHIQESPKQPAAEPEQPAAEPEQPAAEPEQPPDKANSDAAARRRAGKSPW